MIYPKLSDGTIDWCAMCKHRGSDIFDLCCMCNYIKDDDPPSRYEPIAKPTTNADRIRAMTDEELAEWITELTDYAVYPHTRKDAPCISIGQTCAASWLEWLKQEASE